MTQQNQLLSEADSTNNMQHALPPEAGSMTKKKAANTTAGICQPGRQPNPRQSHDLSPTTAYCMSARHACSWDSNGRGRRICNSAFCSLALL